MNTFASHLRVLARPRCDFLTVTGPAVDPLSRGFIEHEGRWWRPGWWGNYVACGRGGARVFCATAMKGSRVWPQPWGLDMRPSRVDVCCDISGFTFRDEHRGLFTSRGTSSAFWQDHEVRTLYVGSRRSPVMLRIYLKSKHRLTSPQERAEWTANGWRGEDVWRVEFELKRTAVPPELVMPQDVEGLWHDALARVRMCAVSPRVYSRQNKAPTHPVWLALGKPVKRTRRRAPDHMVSKERCEKLTVQLERLFEEAGPLRAALGVAAAKFAKRP